MDAILRLPSMPTLKRLSFTLSADLDNYIAYIGSIFVFSNLAYLEIKSTSLKSITNLFSHIQLPNIKDLSVDVSEYTPRQRVQAYWTAVKKACPSRSLARLAFSSSKIGIEKWTDAGEQRLTWDDLLAYKNIGNLQKIDIDVAWPVSLTDADLLDLVSTSPQLEELAINRRWGWSVDGDGGITFLGLVQLLRQCPSLHRLSLAIDAQTFTQILRGLDVSFPPRARLTLDYLDSYVIPELMPDLRSAFGALRLRAWSITNSDFGGSDESEDGSL